MKFLGSTLNRVPAASARRGPWLCATAVALCAFLAQALGQGTVLHITFDWPTPQPPGTAVLTNRYDESGMSFTPIGPVGFVRQGGAYRFTRRMAPHTYRRA